MTQLGMVSRKATSGVISEKRMQAMAAPQMLMVEALPVRATQAMDSP
jgi:hypothetical protein